MLPFIPFLLFVSAYSYAQDSIGFPKQKENFLSLNTVLEKNGWVVPKWAYLDSNILLCVIDSFNTDYKVRLSVQPHSIYLKGICFSPSQRNGQDRHITHCSAAT